MESQQSDMHRERVIVGDSLETESQTDYSNELPQSQMGYSNQFFHSNQLNTAQLQFNPNFCLNRVVAPFPTMVEQMYGNGGSFQSLLNAPNPHLNSQTPTSKGAKKTNQTPNRRWTVEEDIGLAKSYLYVTIDAIIGKDQTSQSMWDRIFKTWKDKMGTYDETRNAKGLQCRWGSIQGAVNKFHGIYESLERAPQSGTTTSDMIKSAKRIYQEIGDGTSFKFIHCWEIMKNSPKWCSQQLSRTNGSKKTKIVADNPVSSPPLTPNTITLTGDGHIALEAPADESNDVEEITRPPGRKGSKEKKRRLGEQNEVINVLSNLQSSLEKQFAANQQNLESRDNLLKRGIELQERNQQFKEEVQRLKENRREKAEKRKEQERIMNTDLSKLQPALRNAFEKMQVQIMKEWEEEGLLGDASKTS